MTNATALLDRLRDVGIRLVRTESGLGADVLPGADLDGHRGAIDAHKPLLLAALDLRDRIVDAATVPPEQFDRDEYDRLWDEWRRMERMP